MRETIKWYLPILGLYYYPKAIGSKDFEIKAYGHFFTTAFVHSIYLGALIFLIIL